MQQLWNAQSPMPWQEVRDDRFGEIAEIGRVRTGAADKNVVARPGMKDVVAVATEENIVAAMRTLWENLKIVIEPSGAVPYAAILEGKIDARDRKLGFILTGGNVDLATVPWLRP
mgnify:CR=1 FL=1